MKPKKYFRNIIFIVMVLGIFISLNACSKSPLEKKTEHCQQAVDHTINMLKKDIQATSGMMENTMKKMIQAAENNKKAQVDKCVAEYNKEEVSCVLRASKLSDLEECVKKFPKSKKSDSKTNAPQ